MRKSRLNEERENKVLLSYREKLLTVLNGIDVSVTIGGSYSLQYQLDEFTDREVSDYDFIITGDAKALEEGKKRIRQIKSLFLPTETPECSVYSYKRIVLTHNLFGKKAELLFQEGEKIYSVYQPPMLILRAKEEYSKQNLQIGIVPREKDVKDCLKLRDTMCCIGNFKLATTADEQLKALNIWFKYFKPSGNCIKVWKLFKTTAKIAAAGKDVSPIPFYCGRILFWHEAGVLNV